MLGGQCCMSTNFSTRFNVVLTVRFRIVNVFQAAAQPCIGIEPLRIEGHHGKMDQPKLQVAFKGTEDFILQHLN